MDTIKKIKRFLSLTYTPQHASVAPSDRPHAMQQTPEVELPEKLPWQSTASPDRSATILDWTGDIYQDEQLPDTTRARLEQRLHSKGLPERQSHSKRPPEQQPHSTKRRISEATPALDPKLGFSGPTAKLPHKPAKPGQGMGFQQINTLNGNAIVHRSTPARKHTYARVERSTANSTSREGFPGSDRYRTQHPNHPLTASPTFVRAASSAKRRKLEKPNVPPTPTFEITDDEAASSVRQASTPRERSVISPSTPRSTVSKYFTAEPKSTALPISEFTNTDNLFDPRRHTKPRPRKQRSKGPNNHRRESLADVSHLGVRALPREQSDDGIESPRTARSFILQDHEQGVDCDPRHKAQRSPVVKSKQLLNDNSTMRINESTRAETTARERDRLFGGLARPSVLGKNLRDFRSAERPSGVQDDYIEDSEDELAHPTPVTSIPRKRHSPAKAEQKVGSSRRHDDAAGKCYRLKYAKTYNLSVSSNHLQLRQDEQNPKQFHITDLDSKGKFETLATIDLSCVNVTHFDNINRIRLTGPLAHSNGGNRYWFDLQLADKLEHLQFRDTYVIPECLQTKVFKDEIMIDLFKKPLPWNDKVGKSQMVSEELPADPAGGDQQAGVKTQLLGALKRSARDSDQSATSTQGGVRKPSRATQAPLRPARSTRATVLLHDREAYKEKEVERPLDYSVDRGFLKRRKATLDFGDLEKLDEGEFLNDSLMTFYMLYLYDQLKVSIDRVYFFNTYFFPTLTRRVKGREGINYDDVKSWTKRDDVFSYDYIVVPINENLHWYLAIICNVSNIDRIYAVDVPQDDSHDPHRTTTGLDTSGTEANSNRNFDTERQGDTGLVLEVTGDKEDTDLDDVNLFEEEALNLVDRDAETADQKKQPGDERDGLDNDAIQDEPAAATSLPTQAALASPVSISDQAKQAPKRKARFRSGPQRKDPEKPVIMILDSLSAAHSNATRALREWLQAEGLEKRAITVEIDNKAHYPKASQIPMQTNFSDCGLYVLGYLKKFFADPDQFKAKLLQQEMSAESDWPDMNPSKMRDDIRTLIFRLNDARNGARKEAQKAKRTANGTDAQVLPTQSGMQEVTPAVQQSDVDKTAFSAVATEADPVPDTSLAQLPTASTPAAPRLGSPFKVPRSKHSPTLVVGGAEEIITARALPSVSGCSNTSTKTSPVRPSRTPPTRTKSPEVRILAKSPHIYRSAYEAYDDSTDRAGQPTEQSTELASLPQNRGQRGRENRELRVPLARKTRTSPPPEPLHKRQTTSSTPQPRTRSGSHDDPITLDDSQDLDVPVRQQPQSVEHHLRETIEVDRPQKSVRPSRQRIDCHSPTSHQESKQHVLDPDNSIQEIVEAEWHDNHDIARTLKLPLESGRPSNKSIDPQAHNAPTSHRGTWHRGLDPDDSIQEVAPQEWHGNRDDSIQESAGREFHDNRDITDALELRLEKEAVQFERENVPDDWMEDIFDAQGTYSQSSHTAPGVPGMQRTPGTQQGQTMQAMQAVQDMWETQPMDLDDNDVDYVVPESPAHRTSSPVLDVADVEMMD